MKIFVSYRRVDSGYLAQALGRELQGRSSSNDVFIDINTIGLGSDFNAEIHAAIARSDVVVALIGPMWSPERLSQPDDFVRRELLIAHEAGRRIVPARHSGAADLANAVLPVELDWLRWLNPFEFRDSSQLAADVDRLYNQLTSRVPELAVLQADVWRLYELGEDDRLLEVVDRAWHEYASRPSPALADCCRIGALVRTRRWGETGERDLWLARAMSIAYQSGASNAFAVSLLPFFFRLCGRGEVAAARDVLHEINRLTTDRPSEFPPVAMMRRLYHEKLGHTYLLELELGASRREYDRAITFTRAAGDDRGQLKLDGSLALCHYLDGDVGDAIAATERVLAAAVQADFTDALERRLQTSPLCVTAAPMSRTTRSPSEAGAPLLPTSCGHGSSWRQEVVSPWRPLRRVRPAGPMCRAHPYSSLQHGTTA